MDEETETEKVVDIRDYRFRKSNAYKILDACNRMDLDLQNLLFLEKIPSAEVLGAFVHRVGTFLGCTNADFDLAIPKLMAIMKKAAEKTRDENKE